MRDNENFVHDMKFKSRNLQVNLKSRVNPLTKVVGWDFRLENCITPTR